MEWLCQVCLLLVICCVPRFEAAQPACNLCTNKSVSCSNQVSNYKLADDDCKMVYYQRNGKECSSLVLNGQSYTDILGSAMLQSYIYTEEGFSQTAFNVTFRDIYWTNITMRFMQNGHPENNSCRDFYVTENFLAVKPARLFYDCLWSKNNYEEKTYNFEYLASSYSSSVYHKYVFTVPRGDRINPHRTRLKEWEVFMYIDILNSPAVILRCQTLPKHLNVNKYLVKTFKNDACEDEKVIIVNGDDDEITYEWIFGILPGNYHFTVQPINADCGDSGCFISRSPEIKIYSTFNLIYLAIGLVAIIVLVLVCAYVKLKLHIFPAKDPELSDKPRLLLVYCSTHSSHIKVVTEMAKYFRKHILIHALVDELDVKSEDPFSWYNDAIASADFIAIVSSPSCCESISGIYPNVYEAALGLLRGRRFNKEHLWKAYNLMVFLLPYCSVKDLPPEAKNIGLHFKVPTQLNEVSYYIHNVRKKGFIQRSFQWVMARSLYFWELVCSRSSFSEKCPEIHTAIEEAGAQVEKCVTKGNQGDFDRGESMERAVVVARGKETPVELQNSFEKEETTLEYSLVDDCKKPFHDFPGMLEDYDLLGSDVEKVEIENSDKESGFIIDNLIM